MSFDVLGIIAPHPPIMVPAVGGADAEVTAASSRAMTAAGRLLERFAPETVVLMSPHAAGYSDAFGVTCEPRVHGDLGQFRAAAERLDVPSDTELAQALIERCEVAGISCGCRSSRASSPDILDHGVLVPMHFLDRGHGWPLLLVSFSWEPYPAHRTFGRVVAEAARGLGRRVAFVASGDCSHRLKPEAPAGYSPRAHLFDETLVDHLGRGDFGALARIDPELIEDAGECGLRSFITLGGFLEGKDASSRVLSYEGPWGVGYLTAVFADADGMELLDADIAATAASPVPGVSPASATSGTPTTRTSTPETGRKGGMKGDEESAPVRLARETIEQYVRDGTVPSTDAIDDQLLTQKAGAFVSLHSGGQLRGCIGTIGPTQPTLAEEIVHDAVQASTRDPRFPALGPDELAGLEISVDVLHAPEECGTDDLDPKDYGVIVSCDWRRGLLLPDLEGVDCVEDQVAIARQKGGIGADEHARLERFKVDRYH